VESSARSPEELDSLLEDAFVLRDTSALVQLFEPGAVLVATGRPAAHGRDEIAATVRALWADDHTYLAGPRRVVLAGETALVAGDEAVHVMQRNGDRTWRYAISVLGIA
jgi:Domain of unknown function (DUF4440)